MCGFSTGPNCIQIQELIWGEGKVKTHLKSVGPIQGVESQMCKSFLNMYSEKDIVAAYEAIQEKFHFPFLLKSEQMKSIMHLVNKASVLAVLPTGYAKSYIFVLVPLILDVLDTTRTHFSFVFVPTLSLMQDLVDILKERKVSITSVHAASVNSLNEGLYSIILITPEYLESALNFKDILESEIYQLGLMKLIY